MSKTNYHVVEFNDGTYGVQVGGSDSYVCSSLFAMTGSQSVYNCCRFTKKEAIDIKRKMDDIRDGKDAASLLKVERIVDIYEEECDIGPTGGPF